ncbi:MAG: outer membrane protein transport protein [bacterium]
MKLIFKSLLMITFFSLTVYAQNGTKMLGVNAKSLGRGGTAIGTFDSAELMMTNPAGISFLNESVIDINLSLMFPTVHFKNTLNDIDGDKNTFPMPDVAYVNKYNDSKFSWGVGVFTAGGMGADLTLKHELYMNQDGTYNLQEYHSMLAVMQGGFTGAYKFNDNFSVGASLHLVYSMIEFSMPYSLDPSIMQGIAQPGMTFGQMFSAPPSMNGFGYEEVTATTKMTDLAGIGFNGKIGFAYKVDENLSFGLTYTLPTTITYKNGKASMDMTAQLNNAFGKAVQGYMMQYPSATPLEAQTAVGSQFSSMGIDLNAGVIANYDLEVELSFPQAIGFGVSYKPTENLKLSGDFEWNNWEKAFDKMKITLNNGNNANINKMLGNNGSFNLDFPLNWKNTVVVKLGGELDVNKDLTLRLGYVYGSNPVPETTVFPVFPAIVEQHLTFGGSYKISNPLTVHAAFETALNNSVTASSNSLIANEYNNSTSELSTILVHVAFSYAL